MPTALDKFFNIRKTNVTKKTAIEYMAYIRDNVSEYFTPANTVTFYDKQQVRDIQGEFIDRKLETLERQMVCKKQVVIIQGNCLRQKLSLQQYNKPIAPSQFITVLM